MKVVVLQRFGDIKDFTKKYEVGKEYDFNDERAKSLIEIKLVKPADENPSGINLTLTDIDMSGSWQKITADVKTFSDLEKLKGYLGTENASDKPRKSVVDALNTRINELSK